MWLACVFKKVSPTRLDCLLDIVLHFNALDDKPHEQHP